MKILVTGGAGYIGSHVVRMLLEKNHEVVIIDNLSRGHIESVPAGVEFEQVDLLDSNKLQSAISKHQVDAAIHFAAFAYVGESVENPGLYYANNVVGSINLINALHKNNVKKIVFSSTCSLYGNPERVPISEDESLKPINPYAKTKFMIEHVLSDFDTSFNLKYAALRYFNAAGASFSGEIGESHDPEPHLIPIVLQAALGKREKVFIYGDDYPTEDGTCIRDYIHVYDLADAHVKALEYLNENNKSIIVNLGTGNGYSVKEIIDEARKITGKEIKAVISERRPGDPAVLIADNKKAKEVLGWIPKYGLKEIISSAWEWHKNPKY
ncbi:MAG: UDP-glucose 4-epimerase GalE [Ignavibacteriales bacterium]|nr:UDP-glucose 4-epimerase GalE [Ignavibacteriales bacterium]